MSWVDVEYEVPEDGEIVLVRIGRHHTQQMRYNADPETWIPCGGHIVGTGKYPHKITKWRHLDDTNK